MFLLGKGKTFKKMKKWPDFFPVATVPILPVAKDTYLQFQQCNK